MSSLVLIFGFDRSIAMNPEELKFVFILLGQVHDYTEKEYKARHLKKMANKIKKDKYRHRKAVKKIKLQELIKELYLEETIAKLDRKRAIDKLFSVISWMSSAIYHDLAFDSHTYTQSPIIFLFQ